MEARKGYYLRTDDGPATKKREVKAKGFHLPGWVGFVARHPVGILVFRARAPEQTGI